MPTLTGSSTKPTASLTVPTKNSDIGTWDDVLNDTTFQTIADYFAWLAANLPTGALVGATDTQTLTNKTLSTGTILSNAAWARSVDTFGGGTEDIVWSTNQFHISSITADTTVTFSGFATSGQYDYLSIEIVQDGTGGRNITWPAAVTWLSGEAPDLGETDANEVVFVQLWTRDAGTTVYGLHNKPARVNYQTGTTYTLVASDDEKLVRLTNASSITVTVPPNSSVPFPNGATIALAQWGAGTVTVSAGAGVTINSKDSNVSLNGQYTTAALVYQGSDVWLLAGDLA